MKNAVLKMVVLVVMFVSLSAQAQTPYYLTAPIGYAAGTTGGGTPTSSNIVAVRTSSELSSALGGSKSVILVSGTITTSRIAGSYSNKTLLGLPGAKLVNNDQTKDGSGILHLRGGSNFIIRNLIFEGPGAYDCDGWDLFSNKGCTRLWVDHCEFRDGVDDNFDNSNGSDNVTVSWCKFTYLKPPRAGGSGGSDDHRFSNLIGGSDSDAPSDGRYSITWQCCWWAQGCVDRMVRARNGQIHMLNCYWNSNVTKNAINLTAGDNGTVVYVESGVFACSGNKVTLGSGSIGIAFVNCTNGGSNAGSAPKPSYSYTVTPVGNVVSTVTNAQCGAGATLQVTAAGVISSSCGTSEVSRQASRDLSNCPAFVDHDMNIVFSTTSSPDARVAVYSMSGQRVYSVTRGASLRLKLPALNAGVYIVRAQDGNAISLGRFVAK
ncbi:MAG: T9SS type A sorting domain-containing protein [Chitinispirillaceae bacterium]|nr:T9SS type A sorting domain-containing protein [Chitinispirillaceae bacterium]